jgi:hypothetical protein
MSFMIDKGCCFRMIHLLSSLKSLIQRTLPSFFGVVNVGKAHSLVPWGSKTPSLNKQCSSFLTCLRVRVVLHMGVSVV